MPKIITKNAKETFALGKKIADELKSGAIIGLIGDLGAGKTLFAQGLAAGLKIKDPINSPTFVIMKVYPVKSHKKIKTLCHIDAYRLQASQDLVAIGGNEYFDQDDAVTLIEWADQIKNILPVKTRFIKIKHLGEDKREVSY